ncbi:hypothetical protein SAMN06265338_106161 [Rhodoblastus acidophilus]|uniref:Flagellar export protein FliJ n=1 Tax=Rhodoblastus acidophilus TaxID=1074 RepID=A0A212RR17_RHOAC|nr:hypothetical protein [Rhodoblastus acidophilus]PPQ38568.1 hypothetical protein CKO16_09765 [Rhodoblastus acidophilus]RAI21881.1 hypothetical protein CH337_06825 [Rhodoblastus acidophilus]SNB74991.1 hypothetical protein SAMN06265338_106161 [Rhodoblastus acidophilus]
MRERHRSLERLLRVKNQLQQMDEAKLEEIRRRKTAAEAEKQQLLKMLGDATNNDPLILGLACRHLVRSERIERELLIEEQAQKAELLRGTAQKKALENIVKETGRTIAREEEKRQLLDIGERLAARAHSSLP